MCPSAPAVAGYRLPPQGTNAWQHTGSRARGMECPTKPVIGASTAHAEGSGHPLNVGSLVKENNVPS